MTLRRVTAPSVEPISIAEAMSWSRIDASGQELPPGALTAALAGVGAGNVDAGVHRYLATFVTADGQTQAGTVSGPVTTSGGDGQVALSDIPLGGALVTARKLYRTAADGATYLLLATLADNTTTTFADNVADASLGPAAPSANTTSDPKLRMLIAAARQVAENITGRAFITQTWELVLDQFPSSWSSSSWHHHHPQSSGREIEIGMLPIQSVTSVKYYDAAAALQTVDEADYALDVDTLPGWLLPAVGFDWPSTLDMAQAVVIRFVAGYGDSGVDVPAEIRMWIAAQVKAAWDNPDGLADNRYAKLPFLDGLLDAYRLRLL
jgi:uncharacterized phiE125 gp8 family phage protein